MEENNRNTSQEENKTNRKSSATGAENRFDETAHKKDPNDHTAEVNGNKGHMETEHTHPTGEGSAIPGAEEDENVGNAASGAGLGRNKGTGTRKKDQFQ